MKKMAVASTHCTMKIQNSAAGVLERTSHYLKAGVIRNKPSWYNAVAAFPPATDLTKKPTNLRVNQKADPFSELFGAPNGTYKTRASKQDRKQKNNSVSRIPKLTFLEDQLRDVFYHQHPWEFARPKVLVENNGDEQSKCDWSHMLQFHKPLDGESVVQRTLWLLQQAKALGAEKTLFQAYDQARFEFYQLRMAEEMESAVSKEELAMYGAVFGLSNLEWGLKKEQEFIDVWVKVGEERTKVREASRSRASAGSSSEEPAEATGLIWESTFAAEVEEPAK